jgi:hypothetical protein
VAGGEEAEFVRDNSFDLLPEGTDSLGGMAAVDFSRFASVLRELGVEGSVRVLPESARTAAAAAEQLGCEVGAIANSCPTGMPRRRRR